MQWLITQRLEVQEIKSTYEKPKWIHGNIQKYANCKLMQYKLDDTTSPSRYVTMDVSTPGPCNN